MPVDSEAWAAESCQAEVFMLSSTECCVTHGGSISLFVTKASKQTEHKLIGTGSTNFANS